MLYTYVKNCERFGEDFSENKDIFISFMFYTCNELVYLQYNYNIKFDWQSWEFKEM